MNVTETLREVVLESPHYQETVEEMAAILTVMRSRFGTPVSVADIERANAFDALFGDACRVWNRPLAEQAHRDAVTLSNLS
jgi:hypothetical protein